MQHGIVPFRPPQDATTRNTPPSGLLLFIGSDLTRVTQLMLLHLAQSDPAQSHFFSLLQITLSQGSEARFQSLPRSSFRVRSPLSDESAHPCARDTPSPKAAGPHRPDRGLRGWPSGVLSPRHQRANIGRRGTWPLPGAAPAMVLSFSQTDGGSDEDVSSPRKMARPVQTCLCSARCPSKGTEIVSARARQRENNEVAPHRPWTALRADGCC